MALKRINKELTDLGRYVVALSSDGEVCPLARMTACDCGALRHTCGGAASQHHEQGHIWLTVHSQRPSLFMLGWPHRR
jgi:hypothetical protein